MNMKDLLEQIALESGVIAKPTTPAPIELSLEDASYAVTARLEEVTRALALTTSLEAMSGRYLAHHELSQASLESYSFEVHHLLAVSGIDVSVSVAVPSFEAGEVTKEGVGNKIKNVIAAILKWIKEKLASIGDFFKRLFGRSKQKVAAAKVRQEEAKKSSEEHLKATGQDFKKNTFEPNGPGTAKPAKEHTFTKPKPTAPEKAALSSLPRWMFTGNVFSPTNIGKLIRVIEDPTVALIFQGRAGDSTNHAQAKEYAASVTAQTLWDKYVKPLVADDEGLTDYSARSDQLLISSHNVYEAMEKTVKAMEGVEAILTQMRKIQTDLETGSTGDETFTGDKLTEMRELAALGIKTATISAKFGSDYLSLLDKTHAQLCNAI